MSNPKDHSAKKTKGRQRIEMKKMENERNLQVTFSRRRSGVFKKASELCTACGADVAVIIFSPSDKAFSFGSPSVESVINRFHNWAPQPQSPMVQNILNANHLANMRELNAQLTLINNEIESEKNRGEELEQMVQAQAQLVWPCPIDDMNGAQLYQLKKKLEALKELITRHTEKILTLSTNDNINLINEFHAGTSSSSVNNTDAHQPLPPQDPVLRSVKQEPSFDSAREYKPGDRFY